MHTYATNVDRDKILILLAVAAIAVTFGINALMQKLMIQIPWWVESPSVMLIYGIFYELYNRLLWRLHIRSLPLSKIPDVSGVWAGILSSSYGSTKIDIVFYIEQTWSKISIRTETVTSTSSTTMAAFYTSEASDPGLKYEYLSIPRNSATPTMHIHPGTGHLLLGADGKNLNGDYYTGRDRQTFGSLELHFVSKEKMSREEALKRLRLNQPQTGN